MPEEAKEGVGTETGKLNIDDLKDRETPLSASEEANLRSSILEELDAEEAAPKKKVGSTEGVEEEKTEKDPPKEEDKKPDEEPEGDAEAEDKPEGEEKAPEGDEEKTPEQIFEKQIKDYAVEHKIPEHEARKDLDSIKAIEEKHQGDAAKLAKSVLHAQRLASKHEEKLKQFEDNLKTQTIVNQVPSLNVFETAIETGKISNGKGGVLSDDQVIELYRKDYEELNDLTDDQVRKFAARNMRDNYRNDIVKKSKESKETAKTVKEKLLNELAVTDDGAFLDDVKKGISKYPDSVILKKDFSLNEILRWARGGKAYEDLRAENKKLEAEKLEAKKEGVKRGREEVEIVGEKGASAVSGGRSTSSKTKTSLSDSQKARALRMYDGQDISDEDKFKAYKEDGFDKDDF